MTALIAIFVCTVIRREKYRFNYGRKWHLDRMLDSSIRLPATDSGNPDWGFMEALVETFPYSAGVQQEATLD